MKTRLHVNQHAIKANQKDRGSRPVLTVKTSKENRKGNTAVILHPDGTEVARLVYRPDKPLSCGARVWIETDLDVVVR